MRHALSHQINRLRALTAQLQQARHLLLPAHLALLPPLLLLRLLLLPLNLHRLKSRRRNYPQAEQLKDAKTVSTDAAEVKEVNGLVNSYEQTMSSVPSAPEGSADTASSDSGQPRQFLDEATMDSINKVAVDNAAEEYAASAAEYAQNGWHYEGTSTVVGSPKVAEGTYQGKRARFVEVCLDSSQVKTKDSSGRELQSGGKRALNIYTLVESDGTWKIAQHDFPNNPDC